MQYFTKDYINFFKALQKNNNKEWFQQNKKTYETEVRKPMIHFVSDLLLAMKKIDPDIIIEPKKCLGRINRDIRFSKDKTPYNTRFFAHITKGVRTDQTPGIAFRFGGYDAGIMAGFFAPNKDRLQKIRQNILADPKTFKKLYSSKAFKDKFGLIHGEANKRIAKQYQTILDKEPLIANKQFYYMVDAKSNIILKENLLSIVINHWKAAKPLNDFLSS